MDNTNGMYEVLMQLVNVYVLLCAGLSVAFTEALMRGTGETITRWKYALLTTITTAIILSFLLVILLDQDMTWQDTLARGVLSAIVAIIGYNVFKSAWKNLPFMKKANTNDN